MEVGTFPNWVEDRNRFRLEKPPDWVLQKLLDFDAQLVLMPSRKQAHYLLTRRRLSSAGLGDVAMLDNRDPDTNMCYAYGVLPIAPLKFRSGTIVWNTQSVDLFLDELRRRDTWAYTGGGKDPDAAWKAVEDHEADVAAREKRNLRDSFYHRARDAWRSIKARSGQRNRRASDAHGAARPAGHGLAADFARMTKPS